MRQVARPSSYTIEPYDLAAAARLVEQLGVSDPVAAILVRRGLATPEAARGFLEAAERHDPFEFDAMEEVVGRILDAIRAGRRITIHGDYDVDGVCSTAILVGVLRDLDARCDWYLPSRLEDGYGLTASSIEAVASRGTSLMITVDCGIGSVDEVNRARALGIEVIVTDHHEPGEMLPECPILHPRISRYPCPDLCATGVAYKLARALRERGAADAGDSAGDLDLVALATVADLVPLQGENRTLVREGLAEIRRCRRPGLRALTESAGADPGSMDEGDLAFRLAPRINAAGRLHRADAGVELMLTGDEARARAIAAELEQANRDRREAETEALRGAERALAELQHPPDTSATVVAGVGWHPGVVGIVASRLVEAHWRPAIVIALDESGRGKGSGRSIPGFDLLAGLRACEQHLLRCGGHAAAAGLEIEESSIGPFRDAFCEYAARELSEQQLTRSEAVDAVVGGESLGLEIAEDLARLAPFGKGNPPVRLLVPYARVRDVQPMGEDDKHARFSVESGYRRALGVAFRVNGELSGAGEGPHDLTVRLEVNRWNGSVEPRVVLGGIYPVDAGAPTRCAHPATDEEWWARFHGERSAALERPSSAPPPRDRSRRRLVDRRGGSAIATTAELLSAGEAVLAVCADALRRRAFAQRAASPLRFGGGPIAHGCGRCGTDGPRHDVRAVLEARRGLALVDWAALARDPELATEFERVVVLDPPALPELEALVTHGVGCVYACWGGAESGFAERQLDVDWPSRALLATLFRSLRAATAEGPLAGRALRQALAGEGVCPLTPEQAARCARVLDELGLTEWEGRDTTRTLRVVSSEGTYLERSEAFRAYRERFEEGRRFLSSRRAQT